VAVFYRIVEPSSPIPFFMDGARGLSNRDFLSLVKDLLPREALKAKEPEA
jgi:type VI secretion system protein ImpA